VRRAFLAAVLLLAIGTGTVRAEVEEVEHFASLEAMTVASDAVVLGRVIDVKPGRIFSGCGYAAATVQVDALLAGTLGARSQDHLTLEYFGFCGDMADVVEEIPREVGVFFLRNKGAETRLVQPDATEAEIAAESVFWRAVIRAGTVVNRNGAAHAPSTYNAEFLAVTEGLPFDDFVRAVQGFGGLAAEPEAAGAAPEPSFPLPRDLLIIAAVAAGLLGALLFGRRLLSSRDRDRD
jgi:hypothetical protein